MLGLEAELSVVLFQRKTLTSDVSDYQTKSLIYCSLKSDSFPVILLLLLFQKQNHC